MSSFFYSLIKVFSSSRAARLATSCGLILNNQGPGGYPLAGEVQEGASSPCLIVYLSPCRPGRDERVEAENRGFRLLALRGWAHPAASFSTTRVQGVTPWRGRSRRGRAATSWLFYYNSAALSLAERASSGRPVRSRARANSCQLARICGRRDTLCRARARATSGSSPASK